MALSFEDEGLRRLFSTLGLSDHLKNFNPNVIYYRDLSVRDALIASSRKALVCLEESQLFLIAKNIDYFPYNVQRFEVGAYHLVKHFSWVVRGFHLHSSSDFALLGIQRNRS